ncbi:MAG TPA: DUF5683 domain-containing protein [Nitrospiria bacterium]|nr:DUF5683 domain-containing protein [Nitrospiria bacterium]
MRSPPTAAFLSAIFPGLGQFYNRQWFKGVGFFIGSGVLFERIGDGLSVDTLMAGDLSGVRKDLGFLLVLLGLLVWSMVDAYRSANKSPKTP